MTASWPPNAVRPEAVPRYLQQRRYDQTRSSRFLTGYRLLPIRKTSHTTLPSELRSLATKMSRIYSRPKSNSGAGRSPAQRPQSAYASVSTSTLFSIVSRPAELGAQPILVWWRDVIDGQKGCQPTASTTEIQPAHRSLRLSCDTAAREGDIPPAGVSVSEVDGAAELDPFRSGSRLIANPAAAPGQRIRCDDVVMEDGARNRSPDEQLESCDSLPGHAAYLLGSRWLRR